MLLALLTLSAIVAPSVARQDEASLRAGLSELEPLIAKADWPSLGQAAQALLEAHADQPYVWLHLPDLRDALQMARFHSDYRAPRWEELTSGELLSYNENSGSLKLRYTPTTLRDFEELELGAKSFEALGGHLVMYVHPAHFHGDYSVEIRGAALRGSVSVLLNFNDNESAIVSSGCEPDPTATPRGGKRPAFAQVLRNGVWTEVARRDDSPCRAGKPFVLKFAVGGNRVTATYKGQLLVSAEKPSGSFGRFGIGFHVDDPEILVQGRAQTSWLQGKRDEHFEKAWQKQFAGRAAHRVLPKPLRPMFHEYVRPVRADRFPSLPTDRDRALAEKCASGSGAELTKVAKELAALPQSEMDPCMRSWLTALALSASGLTDAALQLCENVTSAAPNFAPGLRLSAHMRARLERYDEAIADLRSALTVEPDDLDSLADLAQLLLDLKRLDELDQLLRERAARGGLSESLDRINATRLRAVSGPRWAQSHTLETERYRIVTDIDVKTCRDTARMLEESLKRFEARLRPAPRGETERFSVYVFSGRASYMRYVSDAMDSDAEHTAGLYHRGLRQLLIWNLPSRTEMLETVRHEALHQYLHRFSDDAPVWLNEGLAECYENAQFQRGPSEELRPHPEHLSLLRNVAIERSALMRFVRLTPAEFYANAPLHYAVAWSLTHFLLSSTPTWRRCVDRMLDKIAERAPVQAVVDAGFEGVDLDKLLADYHRHLESLER